MPDATHPSHDGKRSDRGRLVAFPVGDRPTTPPNNLPLQLSSFVGREKELTEITRVLRDTRLMTLTGPGGCGKTRMALATASELAQGFEDGVWFVDLAPLADPALVPQAVGSVIEVREQPQRSITETLCGYLGSRRVLLVLDNCEHLIEASATLAESLLRSSPGLRVMATSREALGIVGEVAWPVPPLTLPDLRRLPAVEALTRYEATCLFVERAMAINPSFEITERNASALARVCYRLDGIPLALELAAARAKVLSVEQISDRLDDCFGLLSAGGRVTIPRHRTLLATMDWSHELLEPQERALFRCLSVFVGGFSLQAAESVCSGGQLEREDVLALLSNLVDKSLVVAWEEAGKKRYRLLEMVQQYGSEKLEESGDEAEVRRRHAAYFVRLAEESERELSGPDPVRWLTLMDGEHDNIRSALAWSLGEGGDGGLGVRLAAPMWPYWFVRGYLSEGRRWLEISISRTGSAPTPALAMALNGAGMISAYQDDYEAAKVLVEDGLSLQRDLGDKDGIATSLVTLGTVALSGHRNDIPALELLEEIKALAPELRDRRAVGHMLDLEGGIALASGDPERTLELWEESLALFRELEIVYGVATCLSNIGLLALGRSHYERATARLREGLLLAHKFDHKLLIQYCLTGLGGTAAARGRPDRAARLWGKAESMSETYGTRLTRASHALIDYDGRLAAARSQLEEAAWTAAWAEGQAMSPEQAVEYALAQDAPPEPDQQEPYPASLSGRETEVLRLVATGLTNSEVAGKLFLSSRTVDWHLASIYRKLGIHSRAEATRFAVEHGLL